MHASGLCAAAHLLFFAVDISSEKTEKESGRRPMTQPQLACTIDPWWRLEAPSLSRWQREGVRQKR
jgi:hypothetical protein